LWSAFFKDCNESKQLGCGVPLGPSPKTVNHLRDNITERDDKINRARRRGEYKNLPLTAKSARRSAGEGLRNVPISNNG